MKKEYFEKIAEACQNPEIPLVDFQETIEIDGKPAKYCKLETDEPEAKQFCPMQGERLEITVEGESKSVYLCSRPGSKAKELAKYETGWWKAHHRKDRPGLIENMAKLYELQFGIPYEQAGETVMKRVEATKEHDIAEELEDEGKKAEADKHWENVEALLAEHFAHLSGEDKAGELAKYEIGWWKAHHRKDMPGVIESMAREYELQFDIPYERATEAVMKRAEATREHSIAEELEDRGNQAEADKHWAKTEDLLAEHFACL
jgi:putative hemolysin